MPPLPSISGSAVYMRISKQRESAATFLANSGARSPAGPQGAGASSWAKAGPPNARPSTAASIAVLIFCLLSVLSPSRSLTDMLAGVRCVHTNP